VNLTVSNDDFGSKEDVVISLFSSIVPSKIIIIIIIIIESYNSLAVNW
jgi:hypothetical protein